MIRIRVRPPLRAGAAALLLLLTSGVSADTPAPPSASTGVASAPSPAADPPDGIVLSLTPGPGPGEVTLRWTGALPPYRLFRSTTPANATDAANNIGQTSSQVWIDQPPAGAIFYYKVLGSGCASGTECPTGFCADTVCCNRACDGPCETCALEGAEGACVPVPAGEDPAGECGAGAVCDGGGVCRRFDGRPCEAAADCLSGSCVDGVCCNAACAGTCQVCDAIGAVGQCTFVPQGADPDAECPDQPPESCGFTGVCSGDGRCPMYSSQTICAPAACVTATTLEPADLCNGAGGCVDGGLQDCAPYVCVSPGRCLTSCTSTADCAPGNVCNTTTGTCFACTVTTDDPDPAFADTDCDGIDGDIGRAIFVDTLTGNDANDGTMASPRRTIAGGIARAVATLRPHVYVSRGTYDEPVAMVNGIGVYGGYDAATGWSRGTANTVFISVSTVANGRIVGVSASNITSTTVLDLVTVAAASTTSPGVSVYGVHASNAPGFVLSNSIVTAGGGGPGVAGSTSGFTGSSGGSGFPGGQGSCDGSPPGSGGGGGTNASCPAANGGAGGRGGFEGSNSGVPGGTSAAGVCGGSGGGGGDPGRAGGNGCNGPNGAAGPNGAGGQTGGFVSGGFWFARPGNNGIAGSSGPGGGGGGGGGGQGCTFCDDGSGNGGGGGAAGGCGGGFGTGGSGGGGSFGVFLVDSTGMILRNNNIDAGPGGRGGDGRSGGPGGSPGNPANGGTTCTGEVGAGGRGGTAGAGGSGGHGGGGAGGDSWAIYRSATTVDTSSNVLSAAGGGPGGVGPGNAGQNGSSGTVH